MTIKYILLAFLAIQAVNGGVIKQTSIEEAFEEFIILVRTYAWVCTILYDRLEQGFAYRSYYIADDAQRVSVAAEIALQQSEEFFKEHAEWGVVCFEGVQDQLAQAYEGLKANNQECITNAQVIVDQLIAETNHYKNAADMWVEELNAAWADCNGNGLCQNDLYKQGKEDLEPFSDEYLMYKAKVDSFVEELSIFESGELMTCVHSYYEKVYWDTLHSIVKPIPKCIVENKP